MDLIFSSALHAAQAKQHPQWLSNALSNARFKTDTWYPLKCDGVAKQAVLQPNSYAIKDTVLTDFKYNNSADNMDCTAMKAKWISRPNSKNVGSLIIWLKKKGVVDRLLQAGTVIFGATQAYCSQYEHQESNLCFNCNTYGHRQTHCRRGVKCGICSGPHNTRACKKEDQPKCPACTGPHPVFDKICRLHPRHIRQRSQAAQSQSPRQAVQSSTSQTTPAQRTAAPRTPSSQRPIASPTISRLPGPPLVSPTSSTTSSTSSNPFSMQNPVAIPRVYESRSASSQGTSEAIPSNVSIGSITIDDDIAMGDNTSATLC